MINSYIALDLETTGLNPKQDKIIEIGAVRVENGEYIDLGACGELPVSHHAESTQGTGGADYGTDRHCLGYVERCPRYWGYS